MVDEAAVVISNNAEKQRYELHVGDELAGFLTYREQPGGLIAVHTEVFDQFEGHGLGSRLVQYVLDDARRRDLKVVPRCPLVAKYIHTHPEYGDLVTEVAL